MEWSTVSRCYLSQRLNIKKSAPIIWVLKAESNENEVSIHMEDHVIIIIIYYLLKRISSSAAQCAVNIHKIIFEIVKRTRLEQCLRVPCVVFLRKLFMFLPGTIKQQVKQRKSVRGCKKNFRRRHNLQWSPSAVEIYTRFKWLTWH